MNTTMNKNSKNDYNNEHNTTNTLTTTTHTTPLSTLFAKITSHHKNTVLKKQNLQKLQDLQKIQTLSSPTSPNTSLQQKISQNILLSAYSIVENIKQQPKMLTIMPLQADLPQNTQKSPNSPNSTETYNKQQKISSIKLTFEKTYKLKRKIRRNLKKMQLCQQQQQYSLTLTRTLTVIIFESKILLLIIPSNKPQKLSYHSYAHTEINQVIDTINSFLSVK